MDKKKAWIKHIALENIIQLTFKISIVLEKL